MQDCKDIKKNLWAFLYEETTPVEKRKIEEHLQGCPSCQTEYENLKQIQAAMQADVSSALPKDFTDSLHLKLVTAAEEMSSLSLWERFADSLEKIRRYGAWKTVAPALVCLVLVVGVFSTGLYQEWQNANPILNPTPSPTETTTPIETTVPAVTEAPKTVTPTPKPQSETVPTPTEAPKPSVSDPVAIAEEPVLPAESEHIPAPASVTGDIEPAYPGGTYDLPRQQPAICQIKVPDPTAFLTEWQEDWQAYLPEVVPAELVPGVDDSAIVLELNEPAFQNLTDYAKECGFITDSFPQTIDDKTLVVITGNEE